MKTAILLAVAVVTLSSLPFVSRQSNASAQETIGTPVIGAQLDSSAAVDTAVTAAQSVQLTSELLGKTGAKSPSTPSARTGTGLFESAKEKAKIAAHSSLQ